MKNNPFISSTALLLAIVLLIIGGMSVLGGGYDDGAAFLIRAVGILMISVVLIKILLLLHSELLRAFNERGRYRDELEFWRQRADQELAGMGGNMRQDTPAWSGIRKFKVIRKVKEARHIVSFYLSPLEQTPLPSYKPGQYLTFQVHLPQHSEPVVRCYSLSDAPRRDYYRITVKKTHTPQRGLVSTYLHEQVEEGDILDVKAPAGHFFLDVGSPAALVLIAGGIGFTPLLSMLNAVAESGSTRETWLFYGIHGESDYAMREQLEELTLTHSNIHLRICISKPENSLPKQDFYHHGRLNIDLLKKCLPANNYQYYVCGPADMMQSLIKALLEWDVPEQDIHYEAFGPAAVSSRVQTVGKALENAEVVFARSGKTLHWTPAAGSLLELAEKHSIPLASGCRAGNCGTCTVKVRDGAVDYLHEPGISPENGACLACIAIPKGALTLDA